MNNIRVKVYLSENTSDENVYKEYLFDLTEKIINIKMKILNDLRNDDKLINEQINNIDLNNKTERVYKDFGKISLNNGIIPFTMDNYKLSEVTNGNRTFIFVVIQKVTEFIKLNEDKPTTTDILHKFTKRNNYQIPKQKIKEIKQDFVYNENDFPSLK